MHILLKSEFTRFLLVGGFAALVNFLSRMAYSQFLSYRWAVFIAYITGMITAYILSRIFVFEQSGKHPAHELLQFSLVNLAAVIQVWLISVGLAEYYFPYINFSFYPEETAHAISLMFPVISSYFGHKYFTFRQKQDQTN
jgi:putative flippase GtrA